MYSEYDHCFEIIDYFDKRNNPFDKQLLIIIRIMQIIEKSNDKEYSNYMNITYVDREYTHPMFSEDRNLQSSVNYCYDKLFNYYSYLLKSNIIENNTNKLNEEKLINVYHGVISNENTSFDFYRLVNIIVCGFMGILYRNGKTKENCGTYIKNFCLFTENKGYKVIFVYGEFGYNTLLYSIFKKYLLIPVPYKGTLKSFVEFVTKSTILVINKFYDMLNNNDSILNKLFDETLIIYKKIICSNVNITRKSITVLLLYYYIYQANEELPKSLLPESNMKGFNSLINFLEKNSKIINFIKVTSNINYKESNIKFFILHEMNEFLNLGLESYIINNTEKEYIYDFNESNEVYNKDISIINKFIIYRNYRDDKLGEELVKYFDDCINSYIKKVKNLKDYINGEIDNDYFNNNKNFYNIKIVNNDPKLKFSELKENLINYKTKTNEEKLLNTTYILSVLDNLIKLLCIQRDNNNLNIENRLYKISKIAEFEDFFKLILFKVNKNGFSLFFTMNGSGLFGINTYLHAFFNKVIIIGVPDSTGNADGLKLCPYQFMDHDFRHTNIILISLFYKLTESFYLYKYIYYKILNSSKLNNYQKEAIMIFMWLLIHEYMKFVLPNGFVINDNSEVVTKGTIKNIYHLHEVMIKNNFEPLCEDFGDIVSNILENVLSIEKRNYILDNMSIYIPPYTDKRKTNFHLFIYYSYELFINIKLYMKKQKIGM